MKITKEHLQAIEQAISIIRYLNERLPGFIKQMDLFTMNSPNRANDMLADEMEGCLIDLKYTIKQNIKDS